MIFYMKSNDNSKKYLNIHWKKPSGKKEEIPAKALFH